MEHGTVSVDQHSNGAASETRDSQDELQGSAVGFGTATAPSQEEMSSLSCGVAADKGKDTGGLTPQRKPQSSPGGAEAVTPGMSTSATPKEGSASNRHQAGFGGGAPWETTEPSTPSATPSVRDRIQRLERFSASGRRE